MPNRGEDAPAHGPEGRDPRFEMTHEPAHQPLDLTDPHHDLHHGHVVVSPRTLLAVLTALLVFTVLTVAASRGEVWLAHTFHVEIPQMVNVGVVLAIAVVKSALVAMYFMQLKYDSVVNTMIFLFCIFAVGLFLFFSMSDLGMRGAVYPWKYGEIQRGGLGIDTTRKSWGRDIGVNTSGKPVVFWARDRRLEALAARGVADPQAEWEREHRIFAEHKLEDVQEVPLSDSSRSIPRKGITPDLFTPKRAAGGAAEGHGH